MPVSTLRTSTVAPGTAASDASTIVPATDAVVRCARARGAPESNKTRPSRKKVKVRNHFHADELLLICLGASKRFEVIAKPGGRSGLRDAPIILQWRNYVRWKTVHKSPGMFPQKTCVLDMAVPGYDATKLV